MNLFTSFLCIFFAIISTISANPNEVAPPRLAPLLAPQASSSGVDCTSLVYDMADCISFLTVGSEDTNPDPECCSGFVKVLKTDEACVCEALKTAATLGFDIDIQRAATLPSACNTKAQSIYSCYSSDAPRTSPVTSPAISPVTNPVMAPTISPVTAPVSAAPRISPVTSPAISPATSPVTAPAISPATSPVTAPANSPQTTPNIPNSPSPAPIVAPNSAAPVPQDSFVLPTPVPNIGPMSSQSPVPSTSSTPVPTANAYAIASSPKCLFSILVASFLYILA